MAISYRSKKQVQGFFGVIIDILDQTWKSDKFKEDEWPCLINFTFEDGQPCLANERQEPDPKADRWALFDEYIRPVIKNINNFSFLGIHDLARHLFPKSKICQLNALTELCSRLRAVVSEFDAVYDSGLVRMVKANNDEIVIQPVSNANPQDVEQLRKAYCELYKAWNEWLDAARG